MHYQSVTSFFFYMYEFFLLLYLTELSRGEKFCRNISSLSSSNWVASMNLPQQIANPLESWFHKVKKCLLWFSCKILAMLSCFIFTYLCNLFHNAFVLHSRCWFINSPFLLIAEHCFTMELPVYWFPTWSVIQMFWMCNIYK